jgi:hypothetical protein
MIPTLQYEIYAEYSIFAVNEKNNSYLERIIAIAGKRTFMLFRFADFAHRLRQIFLVDVLSGRLKP